MWGLFAAANVEVMFMLDHWQTVPFHFIWVSLTILYGFRLWKPWPTALVLVVGALIAIWLPALAVTVPMRETGADNVAVVPSVNPALPVMAVFPLNDKA